MRRVRRRQDGPAVSLFPFLAVLLCTMGALIVLLVFIAGQARLVAAPTVAAPPQVAPAAPAIPPPVDDTPRQLAARAALDDEIRELESQRARGNESLASRRAALGEREAQLRALRDQLDDLAALEKQLDQLTIEKSTADQSKQLSDLARAIARKTAEVDAAKRAAAARRPSYAVVPYEGPYQTRRRPVYIECRGDAVVLQPEGIRLTEDDFNGPLGPGNALSSGVRAIVEHLKRHQHSDKGEPGEPYPMLIVRPDGIGSYYAARKALQGWNSEYGYELVEQDWRLEYRKPNPELAQAARRAVEDARQRQREMLAVAPELFTRTQPVYSVNPSQRGDGIEPRSAGQRSLAAGRSGSTPFHPFGPSRTTGAADRADGDETGFEGAAGSQSDPRLPGGDPDSGDGPMLIGPNGTVSNSGPAGAQDSIDLLPGGRYANRAGGYPNGTQGPEQGSSQATGQEAGQAGSANEAEFSPQRPQASARTGSAAPPPRLGELRKPTKKGGDEVQSLAGARGENWALPDVAQSAIGVRRPVLIECRQDRLILLPERRVIPLDRQTADVVDDLVSILWDRVEKWGVAGERMYWRPSLVFQVTSDGVQRYQELSVLLRGSGLDVKAVRK